MIKLYVIFGLSVASYHICYGQSEMSKTRRSTQDESRPENLPRVYSWLPSNYNASVAPDFSPGEEPLQFTLFIKSITLIDEIQENLGLEFDFQIEWNDTRLETDIPFEKYHHLAAKDIRKIWYPIIVLSDHVKGIEVPILAARDSGSCAISGEGRVGCSGIFKYEVACPMEFHYFPADTQSCELKLFSENEEMVQAWYNDFYYSTDSRELRDFALEIKLTTTFSAGTDEERGFRSAFYFTVFLHRKMGYHLLQTYLPSCLLVILGNLSLFIPSGEVSDPLALCTSVLLTLTALFSAARENTPSVSYIKALDIWMVTCLANVFLVVVEYIILLNLKTGNEHVNPQDTNPLVKSSPTTGRKIVVEPFRLLHTPLEDLAGEQVNEEKSPLSKDDPNFHKQSTRNVKYLRKCFLLANPMMFILFNLTYWGVILKHRQGW